MAHGDLKFPDAHLRICTYTYKHSALWSGSRRRFAPEAYKASFPHSTIDVFHDDSCDIACIRGPSRFSAGMWEEAMPPQFGSYLDDESKTQLGGGGGGTQPAWNSATGIPGSSMGKGGGSSDVMPDWKHTMVIPAPFYISRPQFLDAFRSVGLDTPVRRSLHRRDEGCMCMMKQSP